MATRALPRTVAIPWPRPEWLAFAGLVALTIPILLWLGRDLTFAWDECMWNARGWDVLRPHNEHWSTVPLLAWKGTQAVFGLGSYLPFHALLLGTYVAMVAGVSALLRGPYALGAVGLLMVLGSGSDQLMWAVQIGFVGSLAFGVWALWMLERGRYGLAAVLLILSLASSGMGIPMTAAAIAWAVLHRWSWWLATPVLVYAAWMLAFGTTTQPVDIAGAPGFVLSSVIASSVGLIPVPVLPVLVVLAFAAWRGRDPLIWACLFAIVVEFAIVGLIRDEGSGRYRTMFAVLALLVVGRIAWPWFMRPVGFAALAVALVFNVGLLLMYQYSYGSWAAAFPC